MNIRLALNVRRLREEVPGWTWKAQRNGAFGGWEYIGTKGARTVKVYAVALLVGEDDFVTSWRVAEGDSVMSYAAWWIRQRAERAGVTLP